MLIKRDSSPCWIQTCPEALRTTLPLLAENAVVVMVRYLNGESASEQVILSHSQLASGINLRTDDEAQHLLQLAICKQSDAFVYSSHSKINSANKALLLELLDQTCQVRASAVMIVHIFQALKPLFHTHVLAPSRVVRISICLSLLCTAHFF